MENADFLQNSAFLWLCISVTRSSCHNINLFSQYLNRMPGWRHVRDRVVGGYATLSIDTCNFTSECGFPGSRISLKDEV